MIERYHFEPADKRLLEELLAAHEELEAATLRFKEARSGVWQLLQRAGTVYLNGRIIRNDGHGVAVEQVTPVIMEVK